MSEPRQGDQSPDEEQKQQPPQQPRQEKQDSPSSGQGDKAASKGAAAAATQPKKAAGGDAGAENSGNGADERRMSRRTLLRSAMWGSFGLFFLEAAGASLAMFWPRKLTGFGTKINAGNVKDFKVGSVTKISEGQFYIVHLEKGFIALWWVCPHLGCTVPWAPPGDPTHFHCPCHGSTYLKDGTKIAGPAPRAMDWMTLDIQDDGTIMVDTGEIHQHHGLKQDPKAFVKA